MATAFHQAARKAGGAAELAMAGFAAVAVVFVAFAMPQDILSSLVADSGLPSVLPMAEPPLGDTARLLLAAAGGLGTFVLLWSILRALPDGRPARVREPDAAAAPRIRRADFHADAPARWPISAGSDLGEPLDLTLDKEEAEGEPADPAPTPFERSMVAPASVEHRAAPRDSIDALVERLETGLARRRSEPEENEVEAPASYAESPEPVAEPTQPATEDRLRNALSDLQRFAARGN